MSIFSALSSAASALNAFNRALAVTQNNVANASTPGYARQSQSLLAMAFDTNGGVGGGVRMGPILSARDEYAEQAVRQQTTLLGAADQNVSSLSMLQTNFDITGDSGLPKALNSLFTAFSAWGQTPNDTIARQSVLSGAADVAGAFQECAAGMARVTQDTDSKLKQTVTHANQLAAQVAAFNQQIMQGDHDDSGLDAQMHSDLEDLAQYVPFTTSTQTDGTTTVLLNGQIPLVIGERQYALSYSTGQPDTPPPAYPDGPATGHILAADQSDITAGITTGQMGALLNIRNRILPSYLGDAYQPGDLNTMAKQFADRVNQLLTGGTLSDGTSGVPLFTYDSANDTNVAASIAVNPAVTADKLAAASPGPPAQANGVPLALARLANPQADADKVNGQSYTMFYGDMASRAGSALEDATGEQSVVQSAVAQAQNLRQQSSGVDLNEEAMRVVEFQRAYEANARFVTVLNQLTEDTINLLS